MKVRQRAICFALAVSICVSIAIVGCGKKVEEPQQSPEVSKMREEKKGD